MFKLQSKILSILSTISSSPTNPMATQSRFFFSPGHQPTVSSNYVTGNNFKQPISLSPDFESHHSTTRSLVCNFSPSQTHRITQDYTHSLIAWVVGKNIRSPELARRLHRHLRLTDHLSIHELDLGYFVLKFSETDFQALEANPWSIPNLCIYTFPWIPNFRPYQATDSSIDAWIRLHELPIEYYGEEILQIIAETIGEALVKIDPITKDRKKCKYARICVRIHLYEPLPSTIRLGQIRQEIEYEGIDLLCPRCRCVVHLKHDCFNFSVSSRFQDLNDFPTLLMGASEKSATRTSSSSLLPQSLGLSSEAIKNQKEKYGIGLPNLPKVSALQEEASSSTVKTPMLEHNNLNRSLPSLVGTSCFTTLQVHNNKPQPSSSVGSISTQQWPSISKTVPTFCSSGIERSMLTKEITNTPLSQGFGINRRPILYMMDESITSFEIGLSDSPNSAPKRIQFVISFVSTPRSGTKAISASDSKKLLGWNFRGMDNANLIEGLKYMVQKYETSIVVIFGTKITDDVVEEVVDELGFHGSYCKKFDDYHGGVWLFMFGQDVQTEVFEVNSYNTQQVAEPMVRYSYEDTGTSSQIWGPASFCTSTYSTANALAY